LVPQERINIVKDKKVKKKIEEELKVKISFEENNVIISGEGLNLFQAKNIIKAIGRGFSPQNAFRLFNEDEMLSIIDLSKFSKNRQKIIKSRLIGTKGKTRAFIEKYSGCAVSIYGKTVALIGTYEQVNIAKEAVMMILRGAKHSKVYSFLQRAKL
jgi:ribosomal RNA assembly protein